MPRYNDLISNLGKSPIFCSNLNFGEQGVVSSKLDSAFFILPDNQSVLKMKSQLDAIGKLNSVIIDFNKPFTLSTFSSNEYKLSLAKALFLIATDKPIILTTPKIINQFIPSINDFKQNIITINKNADLEPSTLVANLINIGYKKVDTVTSKGEFAVRGDIVDIYNIVDDYPTRIDFFDTLIEDLYQFDFLSYEKLSKLNNVKIAPNKLNFINEKDTNKTINELEKFSADSSIVPELVSALERGDDISPEFLSAFKIVNNIFSLGVPIIISNSLQFESILEKENLEQDKKIELIFKNKDLIKLYKSARKFANLTEIYKNFDKNLVFFENFDISNTDLSSKLSNKPININFNCIRLNSYLFNLTKIKEDLSSYLDKQIYLCLSSNNTLQSIKKIFTENQIPFTTNKNSKGIILTELDIPYNICFADENIFYIGSSNFAHKKEFKQDTKAEPKYLPKAGEYVVHSVHGIGKCEGVVSMLVDGANKEFFRLTYRGGTLYVPTENADTLSLYMADGAGVTLNKLGGKEFASLKQKAQKSIEDMSGELIELYAKRKASKGFKYGEDDYLYTEFEQAFPYEETNDQLQAIEDVKTDMITGKVMDRLICGDVGFGKTEVAMRALFKAVEHGKQVALLAPTTILSLQHFMSVQDRTKDFGVRVAMLNRFKSAKEQKEIIKQLKEHKLDVVCGTHRLLSADVEFSDLGLLILDEEQRFGVKAKEKIKQMKNNVDVLTLSATPIPRTLSMSLMSIRDISIINTPPINRLPVKTYVLGYNQDIVTSAINEEINRGGQVLVVYNNIERIYTLKESLEKSVNNKNAHFDVAHGQMSEIALENAIKRLYDGETNVFVSTTLIENGIDLPKANTLIVIESDRLGLSQMYQLRGRVGRSNNQAYAYFTYPKNKVLTEESTSRLQAIAENTELGSGFKIAMRDLQIRGAGELLGKTQHGHLVKIGYEMYTKLLNDTIKRLQGIKVDAEREVKIEISLSSNIPYTFEEDETERLQILAKISNITNKEQARKLINELIVKYGKLPKEIYQLSNIALIRAKAIKQKIKHIVLNKNNMSITYYEDADVDKLIKKANKFNGFKFANTNLPTLVLDNNKFNIASAQAYLIEFLYSND